MQQRLQRTQQRHLLGLQLLACLVWHLLHRRQPAEQLLCSCLGCCDAGSIIMCCLHGFIAWLL
jgi:hypothetical protein